MGWKTILALGVAALILALGVAQYGAAKLEPHRNWRMGSAWAQWYDGAAQISVWWDRGSAAEDVAVYAVPMPRQHAGSLGAPVLPRYFETSLNELREASQRAQHGEETRWREVACGWPMRCLHCRVNSPTEVRGGWFSALPRDVFEAQVVPVVPWHPVALGLLVDWLCGLGACIAAWVACVGTVRGTRAIVRHYRHDPTRCAGCRYSLKGLTGSVCPECGRPFADNAAPPSTTGEVPADQPR